MQGASAVHSGASAVPVIQTGGCLMPGSGREMMGAAAVTPRAQSHPLHLHSRLTVRV